MWPVALILGALLAQKKIAGKLETAVGEENIRKQIKKCPPFTHTPEKVTEVLFTQIAPEETGHFKFSPTNRR